MTFLRKYVLSLAIIFMFAGSLSACSALQEWYDGMMSAQEEQE